MGHAYRAVGWNRQKRIYDLTLTGGIVAYLALFVIIGQTVWPHASAETLVLRGLGTGAFVLLHVTLSIGPLCRLDPRFLPLLYNRRHMGVAMFTLAAGHGLFATLYYHAFGDVNPIVSVLSANPRFDSVAQFPFEPLGVAALVILFLMAATSHDFWLANLGAPTWKALHMLVYVAYGLVVLHVALGTMQAETSPVLLGVVALGMTWIFGLHLAAAARGSSCDREVARASADSPWVDVCGVDELREGRARIATLAGERVAVFLYDGQVSAISNVCQHQNGPLGEGRVIDGLVTCPWHGYQYKPSCGRSPEPFTEKVPTFRVQVTDSRVRVDPTPLPPGTEVEPARVPPGFRGAPSPEEPE